jgi:hypothetical protein
MNPSIRFADGKEEEDNEGDNNLVVQVTKFKFQSRVEAVTNLFLLTRLLGELDDVVSTDKFCNIQRSGDSVSVSDIVFKNGSIIELLLSDNETETALQVTISCFGVEAQPISQMMMSVLSQIISRLRGC